MLPSLGPWRSCTLPSRTRLAQEAGGAERGAGPGAAMLRFGVKQSLAFKVFTMSRVISFATHFHTH